jgi:hypothetical protein
MGKIVDRVVKILRHINISGHEINGTLEVNNIVEEFYPNNFTEFESSQTALFYDENISNWSERQELEKDHYNYLSAYCIHKIKENQYFFKLYPEDFTSRKNVIWSQDCIAAVQFLHREHQNILNIFVRSSDAVNLLLSDFLFGCKLLNIILDRYHIKKNIADKVTFFITSCHYYLKDEDIVKKIIK